MSSGFGIPFARNLPPHQARARREALVAADDDHAPGGRHYVGPTAALFVARGRVPIGATGGRAPLA